MALFCTTGQSARVTWQFPGRAARSVGFSKCPIDVKVGESYATTRVGVGGITGGGYGQYSNSNKTFTWNNLDPAYYWEFFRIATGTVFSQPATCVVTGTGASYGETRTVLDQLPAGNYLFDPGVPIRNGSSMTVNRYTLTSFAVTAYKYLKSGFKIEITDTSGYKLIDTGTAEPTYSVKCGGCPPNTIQCGDCCLECRDVRAKLRQINERLR